LALIKLTTATPVKDLEARIAKLEALVRGDPNLTNTYNIPVKQNTSKVSPPTETTAAKSKIEPSIASQPVQPLINDPMKHWEVFMEVIKKKKRTLAALVQEGKPVSFEDEELVVGFPANLKFHLENVKMPNNKELLESILKNLCGRELKLNFISLEEPDSPKKSQTENSDLLKRTVDLFGGQVSPVSKEEK
jgi:DNA polymerase-3 subunit gamma/tau